MPIMVYCIALLDFFKVILGDFYNILLVPITANSGFFIDILKYLHIM